LSRKRRTVYKIDVGALTSAQNTILTHDVKSLIFITGFVFDPKCCRTSGCDTIVNPEASVTDMADIDILVFRQNILEIVDSRI